MRALITGANGQLGQALKESAPAGAVVIALGCADLDITDASAVTACMRAARPDVVFNAAAYTAVDRAEDDRSRAEAVNTDGVGHLAVAASEVGARLAQISTDFVFDGLANTPYRPGAPTAPLGVYGRTKLAGEVAAGPDALVVRTSWLYASQGHNFVRTMLGLMADRPEVRVVSDQIGAPTYAPGLAAALWSLAGHRARGLYHYSDAGVASWYDFAVAIQEEALALGLLTRATPIVPITTTDYPTPARRPPYSVMDSRATWAEVGQYAPHWRVHLRTMLNELKLHG